ncbi:YgaP family membrane protein [Uliginosibacterium aquaticum]|uniref:DUF2892 domain-containing protein n=1 Tax=Uliginosibacterium aquaticum TaxID=2731212 RepID=A0ABX2IJ95_9RHOO|nr:DUF2892 domain-containing protein [Uliginosibacterium aquaticum]NSL54130.1 DUF2892 domain-containing protein [Uliginosibacterium aquaticum]
MNPNVGSTDRAIRVIFGLALIILAATGHIGAWGWIGIVPLATGVLRYCPVYPLFGFRSCPDERVEPPHFHDNLPESFRNETKE